MCCLIVKYDAPAFSRFFPLCQLKIFKMFQRVITLRHSIGFECNLVHEQTTLSPISCSKKNVTRSSRFCTILAFLKNWHFVDYTTSIGL